MSNRLPSDRQYSAAELDDQFDRWLAKEPIVSVDKWAVRERVLEELQRIRSMAVGEYTLWRKWNELRTISQSPSFDPTLVEQVRQSIWLPSDQDDLLAVEPELLFVKQKVGIQAIDIWGNHGLELYEHPDPLADHFRILKLLISSAELAPPVGRSLNFLIRDRITMKYLGIACVSSDLMDLTPRDQAIGWNHRHKVDRRRLNHSATGSTIVPTQPFGFNYAGGKLCALMCLSRDVADHWHKAYGDVLVSVSTTSLYAQRKSLSQYSNMKYWKELGRTTGSAPLELSPENLLMLKKYMRANMPREFWEHFVALDRNGMPLRRDAINRAYQLSYRALGFDRRVFTSDHARGVYFARLYQNTDHFLQDRIGEDRLVPAFDNSLAALINLWKTAYARPRFKDLLASNKLRQVGHFYANLIGVSWEEACQMYLSQVAR